LPLWLERAIAASNSSRPLLLPLFQFKLKLDHYHCCHGSHCHGNDGGNSGNDWWKQRWQWL